MNRKIYISDKTVILAEFLDADLLNSYNCCLDDDTQRGYNFKRTETFEEYKNQPVNSRAEIISQGKIASCRTERNNAAMIRVIEKTGFKQEVTELC